MTTFLPKIKNYAAWLLAMPLTLVLIFFLVLPIIMIVIVSFWGATEFSIYPAFQFDNYEFLFGSPVTYTVFAKTFFYAVTTWAFTLVIGFTVAYYLAFHIHIKDHSNDFMDSFFRAKWHSKRNPDKSGYY
jgi:putative spermidine/putrescine transport system permease protein